MDGHLEDEEDAEDFVAFALFVGREGLGEDVAEGEEAFGEVVVGGGEVECGEGKGVDGGERGEGVEMGEDVFLEFEKDGERGVGF